MEYWLKTRPVSLHLIKNNINKGTTLLKIPLGGLKKKKHKISKKIYHLLFFFLKRMLPNYSKMKFSANNIDFLYKISSLTPFQYFTKT